MKKLGECLETSGNYLSVKKDSLKEFATSYTLIGLGSVQALHGLSHLIPAAQSFILASSSLTNNPHEHGNLLENILEMAIHNPVAGFIWSGIGIGSIFLGYMDRKKHKKIHGEIEHYKGLVENNKEDYLKYK